jgi:hypothetical protein
VSMRIMTSKIPQEVEITCHPSPTTFIAISTL